MNINTDILDAAEASASLMKDFLDFENRMSDAIGKAFTYKPERIRGMKERYVKNNINTAEYWDKAWAIEGTNTWRQYPECFKRIVKRIGTGKKVLDVGGGVGVLCHLLKEAGNEPYLLDISPLAVQMAKTVYGIDGNACNADGWFSMHDVNRDDYVVATELLEHTEFPERVLDIMNSVAPKAIFSVPDNILGPDEEPEHMVKYTPETFRALLEDYYSKVEIETFVDQFATQRLVRNGMQIALEVVTIPTILAYCEV